MGRKHLRVGVNVNAGSFCLFKQHFQIVKVVAGNQDSGIFACADIYLCNLRIAESFGVCLVEKSHSTDTEFSGFQSESC